MQIGGVMTSTSRRLALAALATSVFAVPTTASANVVTDWTGRWSTRSRSHSRRRRRPRRCGSPRSCSRPCSTRSTGSRVGTPRCTCRRPRRPARRARWPRRARRSWRCSLPSGRCSPGAGERVDRWEVGRHPAYDEEVSGDEVFETASVARRHTRTTSRNRSTSSAPS